MEIVMGTAGTAVDEDDRHPPALGLAIQFATADIDSAFLDLQCIAQRRNHRELLDLFLDVDLTIEDGVPLVGRGHSERFRGSGER
jgi:hypothetical protein